METTYDQELYQAVSRLSEVLAKYGERAREIVVTPHLRPAMHLETVGGQVLVLFGGDSPSPWERAVAAKAGFDQAIRDADDYVKKLGEELEAERLQALADAQERGGWPWDD